MIEQRIRELLTLRQLSPTQLADTIGVSRPIVSHILSGRNKASLEVVQKIIAAFPDLSLPWLLSGTGTMTAPASGPDREISRVKPARAEKEPTPTQKHQDAPEQAQIPANSPVVAIGAPLPSPGGESMLRQQPVEQPEMHTSPSSLPEPPRVTPPGVPGVGTSITGPAKSIRRIVIFYQDGTFADFQPEAPLH